MIFNFTKEEIQTMVDSIDFHVEGCKENEDKNADFIAKSLAIKNMLKGEDLKSVIINCNLEIKTPFTTNKEAEEYAMNYELPKEYVEDSFEMIKIINTND